MAPVSTASIPSFRRICLAASLACGVLLTSGCATINPFAGRDVPVAEDSAGQYQVAMESGIGITKTFTGEIEGDVLVSEALEKSGATRKYRSMDIEVLRIVKSENGMPQPLRMQVTYAGPRKGVAPQQDYALHDGDRILVKKGSSGGISQMLGISSK